MKECELCKLPARMYCDSDQASLCWECDAKVHRANFLVARHTRNLLCHVCQSPTPWQASGSKFGPTVSVCEKCLDSCNQNQEQEEQPCNQNQEQEEQPELSDEEDDKEESDDDEEEEEDTDDDDDDGDEDDDGDDDHDDDDEDGDNQVVPWSSTTPPPPIASSSSSEESSGRFNDGTTITFPLKRMRENADQSDFGCTSSEHYNVSSAATTSRRGVKERKRSFQAQSSQTDLKSMAILKSLKQFEEDMAAGRANSATILGMCKLSKDPRAVDAVVIRE